MLGDGLEMDPELPVAIDRFIAINQRWCNSGVWTKRPLEVCIVFPT